MNQHFRTFIGKIMIPTCVFYTLFSIVFSLLLFASESDYSSPGMTPAGIALIFLFSLLFSLVNLIFKSKKIVPLIQVLLHYLFTALDFCFCFFLLGGYYKNGGASSLYVFIAFSAVYLVIALPVLLVRRALRKQKNEQSVYRSIFLKK